MFREGSTSFSPGLDSPAPERQGHVPLALQWQEQFPEASFDERSFELHDPAGTDPDYYKNEIARWSEAHDTYELKRLAGWELVKNLTLSMGRTPEPDEVARELARQKLFEQIRMDERLMLSDPSYLASEILPQSNVMIRRRDDFPDQEQALQSFANAPARIESVDGITRLILDVPNKLGQVVEHPVMTDEESEWVDQSADAIARVMAKNPDSKIFIAGLGLGLLNKELAKRGINLDRQVVAELNHDVILQVGAKLRQEHGSALDLRQGDFKNVLETAVANGERFDAVSIDAFPNTADEVNRDASSRKILELGLRALKPGGILTIYPDSRYIPNRILNALKISGIPETSINYTVARFHTSEFTQQYHYGDLMAVVHIQKPLLAETDASTVNQLVDRYFADLETKITSYVEAAGQPIAA